ncbi:MAG: FAD-dependent oxidoreductase, partial [Bryobacteraceae bacterium]
VTLFDAGLAGGEASSAGAGMLSPGGEFHRPSLWFDLGVESMGLYPAFVEELHAETGLAIDFKICGCKQFVEAEQARQRAAFQAAFQTDAGVRVELTPDGLFYPRDAFVDPTDVLRALRRACEGRNVQIAERQPISEIESADYRAVVVAAGAWSTQIRVRHRGEPVMLPAVKPIKGHLIGFQLAPGELGPMVRRGHIYVLQRSNGFTIVGSNEEDCGFNRDVNYTICQDLHSRGAELFPALRNAAPCARWIGFRPFSPDGPHISRVDGTNVWLAYGHFRNGILLAPLTARRVADGISSQREPK